MAYSRHLLSATILAFLSATLLLISDLCASPEKKDIKREASSVASPACKEPKSKGTPGGNSTNPPSANWYFDIESFECLAFNYNGCGGNENRFDSVSECWRTCKFADQGGCAGMRPPAKNDKGETAICWRNGAIVDKCPIGFQCTMQAFFGICCHSQTQELYKRNYHPHCGNGKLPHSIISGGVPMTLIGKSCDDAFCPSGTSCHAKAWLLACFIMIDRNRLGKIQEIFAHCCPK